MMNDPGLHGEGEGSVFYIPSDLLWVWEHSSCEVKLGEGEKRDKEKKFPTKKIYSTLNA